ncbi:MAG: hypothetical protein K1X88_28360 [Nannocystaceae bacterium]|nr:hypothetical protein [Nannocystaceae bacterium]
MIVVLWLLALAPSGAVHHDVALVHDAVVVESRFARRGDEPVLTLAVPLPASATVDGAQRDALGRVIAIEAPTLGSVRVQMPLADATAAGVLPVPVVAGTSTQRLAIDAALEFHAAPGLGLVTHMGHTMPAEFALRDRDRVDAELTVPRPRVGAWYVSTPAAVREGGIAGVTTLRAHGHRRAAIAAGVAFAFVCGGAIAGYRRVRLSADRERVERELSARFEALARDDRSGEASS